MANNREVAERVGEVYECLEHQIQNSNLAGQCQVCGKCCEFDEFDHRLFVTDVELIYLAENTGETQIKAATNGRCPYSFDGKCMIYEYRFAGCRIFCCNGDADLQSQLSEKVLKKFKSICLEFQVPYRYVDLAGALRSFAGV